MMRGVRPVGKCLAEQLLLLCVVLVLSDQARLQKIRQFLDLVGGARCARKSQLRSGMATLGRQEDGEQDADKGTQHQGKQKEPEPRLPFA